MNKQEAVERIESNALNIGDNDLVVGLNVAKHIINQIDEPQKVVVPKFVAEWIIEAEKIHNNLSWVWFSNPVSDELNAWLKNHTETFMRAWLDGYTIEKEKLYTVEIPNPALDNLEFVIVLKRIRGRVCLVNAYDYMGRELSDEYHLTESEIKQDFDFLWQFAKEVE